MNQVKLQSAGRSQLAVIATLLITMPLAAKAVERPPSPIGMAGEVMDGGFLLQFFAGLGVVVLCILGLAWLMKRTGGLRWSAQGTLRVIDGIALGARERIVLVEVGNTQVLLGVAPGRVNSLYVLDEKITNTVAGQSGAVNFAARLREVMGKGVQA